MTETEQMKLKKQGKSYQVECNGTSYYRMSFNETSIGSWFQISNDRYVQIDDVNLIMGLEQQFNLLELEPIIRGQDVFFVNLEDLEQYEEIPKTVTQQLYEYFECNLDKAIEEYKENFPNPNKLSYDEFIKMNDEELKNMRKFYKTECDFETYFKNRYLRYLESEKEN